MRFIERSCKGENYEILSRWITPKLTCSLLSHSLALIQLYQDFILGVCPGGIEDMQGLGFTSTYHALCGWRFLLYQNLKNNKRTL